VHDLVLVPLDYCNSFSCESCAFCPNMLFVINRRSQSVISNSGQKMALRALYVVVSTQGGLPSADALKYHGQMTKP